ncbi:MAG: FMN-binding negative transcriptional regulator [Betaproteobacteria bacterium]|nr:FMN-binding negative transcriptional regulator [Betaproteobacteria bacterium]
MYLPKIHEETDISVLQALIEAHPLGTWVTECEGELVANHIPFLFDASRGELGTLICHVARANSAWHTFSTTVESLIIFQGPQTYITPSWYPSKHAHGKAVPTWNYAVVHAQGMPRTIEDREWLLRHVNELTDVHEAGQTLPWKVSDAPKDFVEQMLERIVGIEIPLTRLIGKWKVNQNRPEADKLGVIAGLQERDDAQSLAMAALVEKYRRKPDAGGLRNKHGKPD